MTMKPISFENDPGARQERFYRMGLHGVVRRWKDFADEPWIQTLLEVEETERQQRSLDRRLRNAKIGIFKAVDRFDWAWPRRIDRQAIDELFSLGFLDDGANVVLLGPNGVGKTMLLKNLAHRALGRGHTVRFTTASDMLGDLAAQDSATGLARRLQRYATPHLLCVDEVGYLSYSSRYADLLFQVVTRRYETQRSIVLTTNKAFQDWSEVFPHATCTVTLVDRLVHRSELIEIEGESYRLKEAKERAAEKATARKKRTKTQ